MIHWVDSRRIFPTNCRSTGLATLSELHLPSQEITGLTVISPDKSNKTLWRNKPVVFTRWTGLLRALVYYLNDEPLLQVTHGVTILLWTKHFSVSTKIVATRWFKVAFLSLSCRSLNHCERSLNHPKKELPGNRSFVFHPQKLTWIPKIAIWHI